MESDSFQGSCRDDRRTLLASSLEGETTGGFFIVLCRCRSKHLASRKNLYKAKAMAWDMEPNKRRLLRN